jgi:DNA-directed RNA polymerase II subunit RPB2
MKKRTQIAIPHDPNNPIRNPNDQFVDEDGPDGAPWIKVFIGKVRTRKERHKERH